MPTAIGSRTDVSHISDDEMRDLLRDIVNRLYTFHLCADEPGLAACKLLIMGALGFVPLSKTGAELLFELISRRYERGSTLITSNLTYDEWTETFGSERLHAQNSAKSPTSSLRASHGTWRPSVSSETRRLTPT